MDGFPPALTGRFEPRRLVGRGGFATVFEALERASGRRVAVKVLAADLDDDPSLRDRFALEAELAGRTVHPALVAVLGAGEADGRLWLAMEFVEGRTLRAVLDERRPLPWAEAVPLAAAVADALGALHRAGIVHRDVKPENVMVQADGALRLLDLGIAKLVDEQRQLTRTGLILGTPAYLAPELCRGEKAGPAADVYATGLLLLEALSPRHPVPAGPVPAFLAARAAGRESLSLPRGLPPALAEVLTRALSDAPALRPPDGAALAAALRAATARPTGAASAPTLALNLPRTAVRPPPPGRRRRLLPAAALALVVAVGARWVLGPTPAGTAAAPPAPVGPAAPDLERARRAYAAEVTKLTDEGSADALPDRLVRAVPPLTVEHRMEACRSAIERLRDDLRACASSQALDGLGDRFVRVAALAQALSTGPAALAGEDDPALALAEAEMDYIERFDSQCYRVTATPVAVAADRRTRDVRGIAARGLGLYGARELRLRLVERLDRAWARAASAGQLGPAQGVARSRARVTGTDHQGALEAAEAAMAACGERAPGSRGAPTLAACSVARANALFRLDRLEDAEAELGRAAALVRPWPRPGLTPTLGLFVDLHVALVKRSLDEETDASAARGLQLARRLLGLPLGPAASEAAFACLDDLSADPRPNRKPLRRLLNELRPRGFAAPPGAWLPTVNEATAGISSLVAGRSERTPTSAELVAEGHRFLTWLEGVLRAVPRRPEPLDAGAAELLDFVGQTQTFVEGYGPAEDLRTGDAAALARKRLAENPASLEAFVAVGRTTRDDRPLTRQFLRDLVARWEAATAERPREPHPALRLMWATILTYADRTGPAVAEAEGALRRLESFEPAPGSPLDLLAVACRVERALAAAATRDIDALTQSLDQIDRALLARPPGPLPLALQRAFPAHRELVDLLLQDSGPNHATRARDRAVEVVRQWRGRGVDAVLADRLLLLRFEPADREAVRAARDEPLR